jgi:hypothetical protein
VAVDIAPRIGSELASRRRTRLRVAATAVTVVVAAAVLAQVVGSSANDTGRDVRADLPLEAAPVPVIQPTSLDSLWSWQISIDGYQHRLLAAAASHANFTGSSLDTDRHVLTLFGTGHPTADVAALLDERPRQLLTSWTTVPYSLDILNTAAGDISQAIREVTQVHFAPGYDYLVVGLRRLPDTATGMLRLRSQVHSITSIPVSLRVDYRAGS